MNGNEYVKGTCSACGEGLEFEMAQTGAVIQCPHCFQDTALKASVESKPEPPPEPKKAAILDRVVSESVLSETEIQMNKPFHGDRFTVLVSDINSTVALLQAICRITAALCILPLLMMAGESVSKTAMLELLGIMVIGLFQIYFASLLLKAVSAIISLMVDLKQLGAAGTFVQKALKRAWSCSKCKADVTPEQKLCQQCGAEFIKETA